MSDIKAKTEATTSTAETDNRHDYYAAGDIHDIGADLYAEAEQFSAEELEQGGARVRKILDLRIMPIVGCLRTHMYMLG